MRYWIEMCVLWCNNEPMKWDDYQLILALVRRKSVRGAASSLGISHSTVSRRLAQINRGPDGPLIQMSPNGLWPSKAGQAVFEAAEKMEKLAEESDRKRRAAQERLSGPLTLSIPAMVLNYVLMDDVVRFSDAHPNINLTIDATDRLVDLDRAEADIAIRTSNSPPEHWVGRRLFTYGISYFGHKEYLTRNRAQDMVWISPPAMTPRWTDWKKDSPFPNLPVGLTISNIGGRFEALKRGLGLARAACFMADPDPDLLRLPGARIFQAERFWVLSHPDFSKTLRAKTAIKFFSEALITKKDLIQGLEIHANPANKYLVL